MIILVLEASTTSAKAMYFDSKNKTYEVKSKLFSDMGDIQSTHDAQKVYEQMMLTGKELLKGRPVDAIALSDTWHSLLICSKDMKPVSPVYLWSYTGASDLCKEIRKDARFQKEYHKKTGCMVNAIFPYFKLLHYQKEYSLKDTYIMGQGSYNTWRLTGKRCVTECMASGSGLYDVKSRTFDQKLLENIGINQDQLGDIVDAFTYYPLLEEAADYLGVRKGIPVIPANSDGGLNQIGAQTLDNDVLTMSVGTSAALRMADKEANTEEIGLWCYRSPETWLRGAAISGSCNCLDWFKNALVNRQISYAELEKATAAEKKPFFLPFLFGERCPGWLDEREGVFTGILPQHTYKDLYYAVQEGILFNLYQCYLLLTKDRASLPSVLLSGGILNSPKWSQMCANIFSVPLQVQDTEHVSVLGGAIWAAIVLGELKSAKDFGCSAKYIIHPEEEKREYFAERYQTYLYNYEKFI